MIDNKIVNGNFDPKHTEMKPIPEIAEMLGVMQEKYERMRIIAAIKNEFDVIVNAEDFIRTETGYIIPQADGSKFVVTYLGPAPHHIGPPPFFIEKA